ncbi:MAG: hypothetical protein KUG77_02325, partial [Nannocystaceae bacterium]|nr:hypothetical protein [Nannocystaceae bacterium]
MTRIHEVDPRPTSPMLNLVSRFALLLSSSVVFVGCRVPTPVGELQQAVSGAATTSEDPGDETSATSASITSSPTSSDSTASSVTSSPGSSTGDPATAGMTSFAIRRGDLPDLS